MALLASFPRQDRLSDDKGYLGLMWDRWLNALLSAVNRAAQQVAAVGLTAQSASIGATALPIPPTVSGLYRVSYIARITTAASVSSSLTFTLRWTSGGVAQSQSGAAIVGNTTASQQNAILLIDADPGTTITYETTRVSVGTAMQYALTVRAEGLPT